MTLKMLRNVTVTFVTYFKGDKSRDSSVGIATDYGLDDQEGREFESL
jgi:hypothetical protein